MYVDFLLPTSEVLITSLSHSSAFLSERIMEDPMFLGEILLKPKSFWDLILSKMSHSLTTI